MKPNIAEWFKDPPNSFPEEFRPQIEALDIEHAFKTVVMSNDMAIVFDKNLKDVSVIYNGDNATYIAMHTYLDRYGNLCSDGGISPQKLCEW